MWTVPAVVLNEGDREELERRVRAHTSSQREVRRARVVLMAADGVSNRQIAKAVGIDQIYVGVWRKRYVADVPEGPRGSPPRRPALQVRSRRAPCPGGQGDAVPSGSRLPVEPCLLGGRPGR